MDNQNWKAPWQPIIGPASHLVVELEKELNPQHPLFKKKLIAIALGWNGEDVLFKFDNEEKYATVHLTWSGEAEPGGLPEAEIYACWDDFYCNKMLPDSEEYNE